MKKILPFVACVLLLTACSHSKKTTSTTQQTTAPVQKDAVPIADRDGSSFEKAIVITEKGETAGVAAEYKWLRANYPGYKSRMQSLRNYNGKPYDVIAITTAGGTDKDVYFDISGFFGKF